MFFFKKKDRAKEAMIRMDHEMSVMRDWLSYFYHYNQQLLNFMREQDSRLLRAEDDLSDIRSDIQDMPKSKEEFKALVDSYYSFDNIMDRLKMFEKKLESFENDQQKPSIPKQSDVERSNVKNRVLKKIARSSKDYIKNLILNLVSKYGKVSALQLREIVVEEQGLCSKSSFYRILEELEREDALNIVSRGKIKVYIDTPVKKSHTHLQ